MRRQMHEAAAAGADLAECRLDFLKHAPDEQALRGLLSDRPIEVIVTNRPVRQGGKFKGSERRRLAILRLAAQLSPTYIDVEDDVPAEDWPGGAIVLSHHDFSGMPGDLDAIAAALDRSPAAVNKQVFMTSRANETLRAFDILRACRKPTISLAMGEAALCSRILARKFGAFGTFASLAGGCESAPGQPSIADMKNLYRWDSIGPATAVYGVIGCPIAHSMSPAIHNAAFTAAGVDAVYVPIRVEEGRDNFFRLMDGLLERPWLDWRGLSVTIPHKENALAYIAAGNCDKLSRKIGAVNTLTISPSGSVRGDNTDYSAAIDALCHACAMRREDLAGKAVAVLGAGGAARAIVAALRRYRAEVTVFNRSLARAEALAEEFSCQAEALKHAGEMNAEIVINCTPIGMSPDIESSPLETIPACVKVVFDTIYNPATTALLRQADQQGCVCVSGLDMFVNQAVAQFELWTGRPAPRDVMRQVVQQRLAARTERGRA